MNHSSSLFRFRKGFESEPTLHSGINYAVLLLAAGHQFDTSFELRKVGEWTLVTLVCVLNMRLFILLH